MNKKTVIWTVIILLVVAAGIMIYSSMQGEDVPEEIAPAPEMSLSEDSTSASEETQEPAMDLEGLSSVGDDETAE